MYAARNRTLRRAQEPKLGPLVPVIDAILESAKTAPPNQGHTAKRIFERLRIEHDFTGGYTIVKDYVRLARTRAREVFVPLAHPPGHAQIDFGECAGVIGGVHIHAAACLQQPDPPVGAWRGPDAPGMEIRDRSSMVLTEEPVVRIRLDKLPPRPHSIPSRRQVRLECSTGHPRFYMAVAKQDRPSPAIRANALSL
jgi:hypothetical protein